MQAGSVVSIYWRKPAEAFDYNYLLDRSASYLGGVV